MKIRPYIWDYYQKGIGTHLRYCLAWLWFSRLSYCPKCWNLSFLINSKTIQKRIGLLRLEKYAKFCQEIFWNLYFKSQMGLSDYSIWLQCIFQNWSLTNYSKQSNFWYTIKLSIMFWISYYWVLIKPIAPNIDLWGFITTILFKVGLKGTTKSKCILDMIGRYVIAAEDDAPDLDDGNQKITCTTHSLFSCTDWYLSSSWILPTTFSSLANVFLTEKRRLAMIFAGLLKEFKRKFESSFKQALNYSWYFEWSSKKFEWKSEKLFSEKIQAEF